MTVSTEVDHNDYTGNGVTTSFPYTFRIFKKSDLTVQVADLNENITVLTLDTDYSVTGAGTYSGGNVVLMSPLANGWQISISRDLPVTQETDLRNQGKFFAEVHEDAFDKLTMLIQQCFSFLRLALRKPSFIANYYDALNNRIRNLRDPSQAQDAATKNYVDGQIVDNTNAWKDGDAILDQKIDSNFRRTIRVPESDVDMVPSTEVRRDSLFGWNSSGRPVPIFSMTDTADLAIKLASEDEGFGDNLVARTKGGTVHDAITDYYPLADGADPSGQTSSTAAFRTTLEKFTDRTDSTFDGDVTRYPVIKLPDGVFVASNLTIPSMVIIEGSDNTIMVPENPNEFIWDTVNTSSSGGAATRLLRPVFRNIKFGYGFQNQIPGLTIKANAGAVRLINCSYPLFENCEFRFLDGEPIVLKSVWDATFDNTRIMYCGNTRDYNNIKYALNIGPADDDLQDGSNAINFKRIHIEGCPAMMRIGKRTRTISFTDVKMEYFRNNDPTTYAPSLFEGVDGVEFNNVELSWSNVGWPMFKAIGTSVMHDTSADDTSDYENDHCRGINFSSVQIKDSQNLSGDYFQYSSKRGPLVIDGGYIHHARYLLNGSDMILKNIVATQCGPYFGNLIDNNIIENVTIINHRVLPSGAFNIFSVSGKNNIFRDSQFSTPYGSNSNGCAWIAQSSTADLRVENVTFGGKMQWGIKGAPSAFQYKKFLNLKLTSDADYGEIVQGGFSVSGFPTQMNQNSGGAVTDQKDIANDATGVISGCIKGGCLLSISVESSSSVFIGATVIAGDARVSTLKIADNLSLTSNFSVSGTGASGDGKIYLSSSSGNLSVTNRTGSTIKVFVSTFNAKM
ncbi:hypothetical protein AB6U06_11760 [Klebsiella pneumoniae]